MKEIYQLINNKFFEESENGIIERKKCNSIMGFFFRIPKEFRPKLIKNMSELKMIEFIHRDKIKIKKRIKIV